MVHQLRCGGVLEAVRISCAGYPSRMLYEEFVDRFWVLAPHARGSGPGAPRAFAQHILTLVGIPDFQLGKGKVFLRSGHLATLEKRRAQCLQSAAVKIQAHMRGFHQRRAYERIQRATALLQRVTRGFLARQKVRTMRREAAAVRIQRMWRGARARRSFARVRAAAVAIQAAWRGKVARAEVAALRRERAALAIQSAWRMHTCRAAFLEQRAAAVRIQSAWRALCARRLLRKLKREARESTKLLEDNRSLQDKVRELREEKENVINQRNDLKNLLGEARAQMKKEREEARGEVDRLEAALAESTAANRDLTAQVESERAARTADVARLGGEVSELKLQLEELRASLVRAGHEHRTALEELAGERARLQGELLARDATLQRLQDERDAAAEKLVMAEAAVDKLQRDLESAKAAVPVPPPAPLRPAPSLRIADTAGPAAGPPQSPHLRDPHPAAFSPAAARDGGAGGAPSTPPSASADGRLQRMSQAEAERERQLVELLSGGRLGFVHGRPVAALAVFRCAVEWKAFQNTSTSFFDRVMESIQLQLHKHTEGGIEGPAAVDDLAYWLSVQANLLALIQRYTRASMQTQPGAGRTLTGNFGPGSATKLNIKGWAGAALAMFSGHGKHPALPAPEHEDPAGTLR